MTDVALVIGVSRYQALGDELPGSVPDALRFTRWLLEAAGVRRLDIRLLLSPLPADDDPLLAGVKATLATRDNVVIAANELVDKSGDRLFVYFAGHGISAEVNNAIVPVILMSDFSWMFSDRSFTVDSLRAFFASHDFARQFFFIDACRDMKAPEKPVIYGRFPTGGALRIPSPQQFGLHATSPGLTANQLVGFQRESGAFTRALLDGLAGAAKLLDENALRGADQLVYQVTYQSLATHVIARVLEQRLPGAEAVVQEPRSFGEYSSNPVLARFEVDRSADSSKQFMSKIEVAITHPAETRVERVVFEGPFQLAKTDAPWEGELYHGTYWVKAHGAGLVNPQPWPMIELGGTTKQVAITLKKQGGLETTTKHIDLDPYDGRQPVVLEVGAGDPLAMLELVGPDGIIAAGFGALSARVWPGAYRIRTRGDVIYEQPIVIDRRARRRSIRARAVPPPAVIAPPSPPLLTGVTLHALAEVEVFLDDAPADISDGWRRWAVAVGTHVLRVVDPQGRVSRMPVHVLPDHATTIVISTAVTAFEVLVVFVPAGGISSDAWRTAVIAQRALARGELRWTRLALDHEPHENPTSALVELAASILDGTPEIVAALGARLAAAWPALPDFAIAQTRVRRAASGAVPMLRVLAGDVASLVPSTPWVVHVGGR